MLIDKSKLHASTQHKPYSIYNDHSICAIDAFGSLDFRYQQGHTLVYSHLIGCNILSHQTMP